MNELVSARGVVADALLGAGTWIGTTIIKALYSEVFWVAVQAIGTICTLYLIYRQIANARATSAYEFVRKEDDRFDSEEMKRQRSMLARTLLRYPRQWQMIDARMIGVVGYFEDLGLLVRKGVAPIYFVWTVQYDSIVHYWETLYEYVVWVRTQEKDDSYYIEFQSLYSAVMKQQRRFNKKFRARKVEELTDLDLRQFLQNEVRTEIRSVESIDLEALIDIEKGSFAGEAYSMRVFRRLVKDHHSGFFVATIDGRVVGYIVGYVDGAIGEIDSMAVHPRFRRFGVGRRLLIALSRFLRRQGVETLGLEVRPENEGALHLYKDFGFIVSGQLVDYYGRGEDAYRMSCPAVQQVGAGATPRAGSGNGLWKRLSNLLRLREKRRPSQG